MNGKYIFKGREIQHQVFSLMVYDPILHLRKKELDCIFGIIKYTWALLFSFYICKHYYFKAAIGKQWSNCKIPFVFLSIDGDSFWYFDMQSRQ